MKFPLQGHPGAKKEGWCARMLNKQIQTLTTHPADAKREVRRARGRAALSDWAMG